MKSVIAKPMFTPADSLTPTTFTAPEHAHHHDAADDVSRATRLSGSQKTPR